jgi:prevent-host-death family protein
MGSAYSTREAKSHFNEVIRKVKAGKRVAITYRGEEVSVIVPPANRPDPEQALRLMEEQGLTSSGPIVTGPFQPAVRKPGALKRFLESRE